MNSLSKNREFLKLVIISFIPMIIICDSVVIL